MLVLYFAGSDYGVHDNGEITLVYQDEGFVSYLGHNQEGFYSLYEESYAEAYQKLYGTSIPIRKF